MSVVVHAVTQIGLGAVVVGGGGGGGGGGGVVSVSKIVLRGVLWTGQSGSRGGRPLGGVVYDDAFCASSSSSSPPPLPLPPPLSPPPSF